jgi:hypothetical protein
MNQTAGYMEAETQKPQHQDNDKDCPKHMHSIFVAGA